MDERQMKQWHAKREALFAVNLPHSALSIINQQLPNLDFDVAMEALEVYAQRKPYKGFYMLKYMAIYEKLAEDHPRGGQKAPKGASAPAKTLPDNGWQHDERAEREAYEALPDGFKAECERKYADYGWRTGTRQWRLLCLRAAAGQDVECYRVHPPFASRAYDRERDFKMKQEEMERIGYVQLIEKLRREVEKLGGNINVTA
jgi:hypothetical protein